MSNKLGLLSALQLRKAASLRERIDALEKELNAILGDDVSPPVSKKVPTVVAKEKRTRRFSKATRARMAARAKERWAKAKASGKKTL